jgi:NDP-hexose-3-ketoreductase
VRAWSEERYALRVLILGNSAIAAKRVVPALDAMDEISGVDIASVRTPGAAFDSYESALAKSDAELVYVSLVNSDHALWSKRALESGRHVIVDKPAVLESEQARELVELSRACGLCIAEATAYAKHPQIEQIAKLFEDEDSRPTRITATFSFPPVPDGNFRYQRSLGGGAIYDLGPYAVSPGRLFFGSSPIDVQCRVLATGGADGVPTAFSVLMEYEGGRSMVGTFGFDTAYCNRLSILGEGLGVDVDRVFTTPEDLENKLRIYRPTGGTVMKTSAGDCFKLFFEDVLQKIGSNDLDGLRDDMLADASAIDRLRESAKGH